MSVHRLAKYQTDDPFTRVPNSAINDERLDLKARGLLLLMLSKPDGWVFRERHLAQIAGVGRDQLRAAMATLIETGYVVRTQESFDGNPPICVTRVYDMPQHAGVGLAEVGFPDRGETRPFSNEGVLVTNETNLAATPKEQSERPKDNLFETVAQVCGISITNLTRTSRGQLNKAVKELREVGATEHDITAKAKAYRTQYPNATLTPTALIKHWSSFTQIEKQQSRPSIWDTYNPPEDYYA
jgi:biotin operon repressor